MSATQNYPQEFQELFKSNLIESNADLLLYAKLQHQKEALFLYLLLRYSKDLQQGEFKNYNTFTLIETSLRNINLATAIEENVERIERAKNFET